MCQYLCWYKVREYRNVKSLAFTDSKKMKWSVDSFIDYNVCFCKMLKWLIYVVSLKCKYKWTDLPATCSVCNMFSCSCSSCCSPFFFKELDLFSLIFLFFLGKGDRSVGDLRVLVFSSEFLFVLSLLILLMFEPCEYKLIIIMAEDN